MREQADKLRSVCPMCHTAHDTTDCPPASLTSPEPVKVAGVMVFLRNLKHAHERWMMRYLRKRGWVVFYLEKPYRKCDNQCCWLELSERQ